MGDAEMVEEDGGRMTVGARLREAREASGLSLEEIATATRIPTRHLESLEAGDFSRLPAPTYTIGFAKNFAGAVGLDRQEIGEQLRSEMGGTRTTPTTTDLFEPADPKRAMPKWLIFATLGAILLVVLLFGWLNNRALEQPDAIDAANSLAEAPAPAPAEQTQLPVAITASAPAWVEIKDGDTILKQGELAPGETFTVPATAVAPTLTTAKPEALGIKVGDTAVAAIGPAGQRVTVSLKPADLTKPVTAIEPAPAAAPPPANTPRTAPAATAPRRPAPRPDTPVASPPAQEPPAPAQQQPAAEPTPQPTTPQQ